MTKNEAKNAWVLHDKKRALFWVAVEDHLGHLDDSHAAAHAACAVSSMKEFAGTLDKAIALVMEYAKADAEHQKRAALAGIKTLSVTYERKFNLGNYQSLHIGMTSWADVHDDTTADAVQAELWKWVKAAVKEQALPVIDTIKSPTSQTKAPITTKQLPIPARPAPPSAPGNVPPPPPTLSSQTSVSVETGVIKTEFVRITAPKGKPIVEFWRPNRKYYEIRWQLGGEKLLAIAPTLVEAQWQAAHFDAEAVGQEYQLPVNVYWAPSEPDGKYKDISLVELR